MSFRVGDAVKIKQTSQYYGVDDDFNPAEVVGEIVHIISEEDDDLLSFGG